MTAAASDESRGAPDAAAGQAGRGLERIVPWALVALAVAVYATALGHGFAVDDGDLVQRNPWIRDLRRIGSFFLADYWEPVVRSGLYRPLVTVSYALSHAITGAEPTGFRAVNLGLHATATVLVWAVARRLLSSARAALAAGILFAVQAVHTEAVVGISAGRPELLAAIFFLGALLLAVPRPGETTVTGRRTAGSLGLFGLALLAKESAVTLVGVIALCDWARMRSRETSPGRALVRSLREGLPRYAAYVAVTLVYLGLRWLALRDGVTLPPRIGLDNPLIELGLLARVASALEVSWRAVGLLLFPRHLSYDYSFAALPWIASPWSLRAAAVVAASAGALGIWLASYRRAPRAFLAAGFFVVTYSVVSNVVIPIGTVLGERLLYVPSVGFCLLAGVALEGLAARIPSGPTRGAVFAVCLAAVALPQAARAVARSRDWTSMKRLYLHDLRVSPGSAKVHANAAGVLARWGRYEEAIAHYQKAIEIRPEGYAQPYQGLGFLLLELGRPGDALGFLERAARIAPRDPGVLGSLALGHLRNGRPADALEAIDRALRLDSSSPAAQRRQALREEIQRQLSVASGLAPESQPPHGENPPTP